MIKVQLSELTEKDVENLMNNSKVWEKTIDAIENEVALVLNDFLEELKGLDDYSISDSSDRNNCLTVKNSYYFLGSLEEACDYNAGVLSDKQIAKANKLVSKYDKADDEQREQLESDMDKSANNYANILLDAMVADYDVIYDKDYVKDFMFDSLEYAYPEGAYYNRKDNSIYYMVKD